MSALSFSMCDSVICNVNNLLWADEQTLQFLRCDKNFIVSAVRREPFRDGTLEEHISVAAEAVMFNSPKARGPRSHAGSVCISDHSVSMAKRRAEGVLPAPH